MTVARTAPIHQRAFAAAYPLRSGRLYVVPGTVDGTARGARSKAAAYWSDGWRYASRRLGWRIIPVQIKPERDPAHER
jgi:hypothetical protein